MSEAQVKATPSKAAMDLAIKLGVCCRFDEDGETPVLDSDIAAELIQFALRDLLEKAETLRCAFGGYAPTHGCACNNCDLANALEPWKPK